MIATYAFTHTELKDGWTAVGNKYVPFNPSSSIGAGVVFGGALCNFVASVPRKVFITDTDWVLGMLKRVEGTETPWKYVYIHAGEVDPSTVPPACFLLLVQLDTKGYIRCLTPYDRPLFTSFSGDLEHYASYQYYSSGTCYASFAPVETEEDVDFDEKVQVQTIRIYDDAVGLGAVYYSTLMGVLFSTIIGTSGTKYKFEYPDAGGVFVSKFSGPDDTKETAALDIASADGAAMATELDPTLKVEYMSAEAMKAKFAEARAHVLKQTAALGIRIPGRDTLKRIGIEGPY